MLKRCGASNSSGRHRPGSDVGGRRQQVGCRKGDFPKIHIRSLGAILVRAANPLADDVHVGSPSSDSFYPRKPQFPGQCITKSWLRLLRGFPRTSFVHVLQACRIHLCKCVSNSSICFPAGNTVAALLNMLCAHGSIWILNIQQIQRLFT